MVTAKKLGIWMDHASAHLMEFTADPVETKTIESAFTHQVKEDTIKKSESLMDHKGQHEEAAYYKELGAVIENYDEVLLFGPTDAKTELFNILKADTHYNKVKIDTAAADKMTENEQHAFVKEHFSKHRLLSK